MLRIDTRQLPGTHLDVRVAGRLGAESITELEAAVHTHMRLGRHVFINLSGITNVDREGIAALLRLSREGARIAHCPPFLTLWLRAEHWARIHGRTRIRAS